MGNVPICMNNNNRLRNRPSNCSFNHRCKFTLRWSWSWFAIRVYVCYPPSPICSHRKSLFDAPNSFLLAKIYLNHFVFRKLHKELCFMTIIKVSCLCSRNKQQKSIRRDDRIWSSWCSYHRRATGTSYKTHLHPLSLQPFWHCKYYASDWKDLGYEKANFVRNPQCNVRYHASNEEKRKRLYNEISHTKPSDYLISKVNA